MWSFGHLTLIEELLENRKKALTPCSPKGLRLLLCMIQLDLTQKSKEIDLLLLKQ